MRFYAAESGGREIVFEALDWREAQIICKENGWTDLSSQGRSDSDVKEPT